MNNANCTTFGLENRGIVGMAEIKTCMFSFPLPRNLIFFWLASDNGKKYQCKKAGFFVLQHPRTFLRYIFLEQEHQDLIKKSENTLFLLSFCVESPLGQVSGAKAFLLGIAVDL